MSEPFFTHPTASAVLHLRQRCGDELAAKVALALDEHKRFYSQYVVGIHDGAEPIGLTWKAAEAKAHEAIEVVTELWVNSALPEYDYVMEIFGDRADWHIVKTLAYAYERVGTEDRRQLLALARELVLSAESVISAEAAYIAQVFASRDRRPAPA